ncbi:hypothetical protein [Cnuella takakiae]|nr:hypothetical protein [Cnuella takakiae]
MRHTEINYLKETMTLEQYQRLYLFHTAAIKDKTEGQINAAAEWINSEMVKIAYNISDEQLNSLPVGEYYVMQRNLAQFTLLYPEANTRRYIKANGNWYYLELLPSNLPTVASFRALHAFRPEQAGDFFTRMHYLVALMVRPSRRICGIFFRGKHNLKDVEKYSEDLKQARFIDVIAIWQYYLKGSVRHAAEIVKQHQEEMIQRGHELGYSPEEVQDSINRIQSL